jgi:oligosaccharide repeat unit polymerase
MTATTVLRHPSPVREYTVARTNDSRLSPTITLAQWLLAMTAVGVAAAGLLSQSVESAVIIAIVTAAISLLLTALATYNTLRSGLIGQAAMLGALWIMLFMEAVQSALSNLPFSAPEYFHFGQFNIEVIHRALLHLCLFQLMLLVGFVIPGNMWGLDRWFARRFDIVHGRLMLQVALAACIPLSFGSTYGWNWGQLFRSMLGSYSLRLGEDSALLANPPWLTYLFPIGLYGASVLFVEALQTRGIRRWIALIVASIATFIVVMSGSRHTLLVILLPACAVILRLSYKRLRISQVLLWGSAILLLFCIFQIQVVTRDAGWNALETVAPDQLFKAEVTGQFPALLLAESLVPARHDFFLEPTPIYFITHWIPHRFWPEKPVDKVWEYFNDEVTGGDVVWNVSPSVIGQFYMNCGVIGVCAIGCFLGMLCRITDNVFARLTLCEHRAAAVCVATLYVFAINSLRLVAPFYIVYSVMAFVGMIILTRRVKFRYRVA